MYVLLYIKKDGIGAAGRLLVGGRLGLELDDDPRRYVYDSVENVGEV